MSKRPAFAGSQELNDAIDKMQKRQFQSRFENLPEQYKPCTDPSHGVPNILYVPPGQVYIHICPTCHAESRLYPQIIRM